MNNVTNDLVFCTIFDSNYLDKGLVLYDSMCKYLTDFKLYVFAFDEKCYQILKAENYENMIVVSLKDFESEELLKIKMERTKAEYCWTCSSWTIRYVLDTYNENICTYIDADMMFFSDPTSVFNDMRNNKCSIIIVPHRFETEEEEQKAHDTVGSYCVQFNTFVNDDNGRKALNWWTDKCLEWCYYTLPGTTEWYGDQKYLNLFPEMFEGVYICNHYGVGLAPWNTKLVDLYSNNEIIVKKTNEIFPIVIYHYECVNHLTKHIINVSTVSGTKALNKVVYDPYVDLIVKKRKFLKEKYNYVIEQKHRELTNDFLLRLYHRYVSPIKRIRTLSNLYFVKE